MSAPRMVIPNRTYLLTRKCSGDRLYLSPKRRREEERIYLYCVALAAIEHGIDLIAFCCMGTHHHVVFHDSQGVMPSFVQYFHELLAKAMNAHRGRKGSFFEASEKANVVHCVEPADVLDKIIYTIMNPVAANLVERPEQWPGAVTLPHMYGPDHEIVVKKPCRYFRQLRRDGTASGEVLDAGNAKHRARMRRKEKEPKPDELRIKLVIPPGFEDYSRAEFETLVTKGVALALQRVDDERRARKRPRALGVAGVLRQNWREPPPSKKREQREREKAAARGPGQARPTPNRKPRPKDDSLFPHIACAYNDDARAAHRKAMVEFWEHYRVAYLAFRNRKRGVVFPAGTWGPKRVYNVRVSRAAA